MGTVDLNRSVELGIWGVEGKLGKELLVTTCGMSSGHAVTAISQMVEPSFSAHQPDLSRQVTSD